MTNVYLERSGDRYTVHCQGHAVGNSAVCAAVSILTNSLMEWLSQTEAEVLRKWKGDADFFVCFRGGEAANAVFDMVCIGLCKLENKHGEYIKVNGKNISFTG